MRKYWEIPVEVDVIRILWFLSPADDHKVKFRSPRAPSMPKYEYALLPKMLCPTRRSEKEMTSMVVADGENLITLAVASSG